MAEPSDAGAHAPESDGTQDLIVWSLSLSPEERPAVLQDFVDTFWTRAQG